MTLRGRGWWSGPVLAGLAAAALLAGCRPDRYQYRVLGAVLPLTGSASEIGDRLRKGIELGLAEKNLAIRSLGRQYVMSYEDSRADAAEGREAVQRLIARGVPAIVGPATSGVVLAAAELANQNRVVLLSPTASNPTITQAGDYVFRITSSDVAEALAMATYCRRASYRRVSLAIIANAYGDGFRDAFSEQFQILGGKIASEDRYPQDATDFGDLVRRLIDVQPDAVYLVGYEAELARFLLAARAAGLAAPILSTGSFRFEPILRKAGATAEGVVFTQPAFDPEDPSPDVRRFVEEYRRRYGLEPDIFAAHAYDAVRVLISVADVAGYDGPKIRSSLHALDDFAGASGPIAFDAYGDVRRLPRLWTVAGGRFRPLR